VRGTVRSVDTRSRTVNVDTSSRVVTVYYDSNTTVEFQGRTYQPENLERGDQVEIDTRDASGGRLLAEQITVLNDSRGR
jgi:hypothetical protein